MNKNGGAELLKKQSGDLSHRSVETVVVDKEVHMTKLHLVFFNWLMSSSEVEHELRSMGFRLAKNNEIPEEINFDQYSGGKNWLICLRVVAVRSCGRG